MMSTAPAPIDPRGPRTNQAVLAVALLVGFLADWRAVVPIFAVGRIPGWTVQVMEQMESNILIRPLTLYSGAPPRAYVPIDARRT